MEVKEEIKFDLEKSQYSTKLLLREKPSIFSLSLSIGGANQNQCFLKNNPKGEIPISGNALINKKATIRLDDKEGVINIYDDLYQFDKTIIKVDKKYHMPQFEFDLQNILVNLSYTYKNTVPQVFKLSIDTDVMLLSIDVDYSNRIETVNVDANGKITLHYYDYDDTNTVKYKTISSKGYSSPPYGDSWATEYYNDTIQAIYLDYTQNCKTFENANEYVINATKMFKVDSGNIYDDTVRKSLTIYNEALIEYIRSIVVTTVRGNWRIEE